MTTATQAPESTLTAPAELQHKDLMDKYGVGLIEFIDGKRDGLTSGPADDEHPLGTPGPPKLAWNRIATQLSQLTGRYVVGMSIIKWHLRAHKDDPDFYTLDPETGKYKEVTDRGVRLK